MAVRIKERVIEEIEEIAEGRVVEIPIAPERRSTHKLMRPEDLSPETCGAVIINRLVERCQQKGKDSPKVQATKGSRAKINTNHNRHSGSKGMYISNKDTNKKK